MHPIDEYVIPPLSGLETITSSRDRSSIIIYWDDNYHFDDYRIFKSNGSINSKQYKKFLEHIRNIITECFEDKILNVLTRLENIKQK